MGSFPQASSLFQQVDRGLPSRPPRRYEQPSRPAANAGSIFIFISILEIESNFSGNVLHRVDLAPLIISR